MHGYIDNHVTCMEKLTAIFLKVYVMKVCKLEVWKFASPYTRFESLCCEKCVSWKFASRHTHVLKVLL